MDADTKKELSAMRRMGSIMEPLSPASRARVLAWLAGVYRTAPEHKHLVNVVQNSALPPGTAVITTTAPDTEKCELESARNDYRTIRKRGQVMKL